MYSREIDNPLYSRTLDNPFYSRKVYSPLYSKKRYNPKLDIPLYFRKLGIPSYSIKLGNPLYSRLLTSPTTKQHNTKCLYLYYFFNFVVFILLPIHDPSLVCKKVTVGELYSLLFYAKGLHSQVDRNHIGPGQMD